MLSDDSNERPPASAVIKHIYLLSSEDVLQFINVCFFFSAHMVRNTKLKLTLQGCKSALMGGCNSKHKLELRCQEVTNSDWHKFEHMYSLMDGRRYDSSITDLIRLIRNKVKYI
jgi:hypothetical protein